MAQKPPKLKPEYQVWVEARQRHGLSHAQVQMARELGMNPKKLGGLDNHKQERWKDPLPIFIERIYRKQFGKDQPDCILPIEEIAAKKLQAKRLKSQEKARRRAAAASQAPEAASGPAEALATPPGPQSPAPKPSPAP